MTTHNSQYSAETTHPDKQESSPVPDRRRHHGQ